MKEIAISMVILIALFLTGCEKEVLPQGYTVLCSFEGNKYTLKFPDGSIGPCIWPSERRAIHFAVYYEGNASNVYVPASDAYEWDECK